MRYIQSYITDRGTGRKMNQDSLALLKAKTDQGELLLAVISDGMGGHQRGELASKTVVKSFEKWFKTKLPYLFSRELNFENIKECWEDLIRDCNRRLVNYGQEKGVRLGSTVTAFLFFQDMYVAAHVGDSRGYRIDESNVSQITRDHSLVEQKVEEGIMTEEEAKKSKKRNILLQCVGITPEIQMEFYRGTVKPHTFFLLCSDGFWHCLENEELKYYLSGIQIKDNRMLRMHLTYLCETVKQRNETDNITALGVIPVEGKG